ncbi:hypothetical protein LTR70_004597 [Exophiala xenobiotica]|uniref:Uncharacterized protein n=1 Tax=Lithohypha guttulata TaxID=1690604 RepID=A0ABR0KD63_9EURO|nr:hypothetical protein LTR24_004146 [Lithohypha guttulata]KAK5320370.1 hypothetical protein LTR70_004597 [Exophiala xenobiotica]
MKLPLIAGLAATATLTTALVIPSHASKPSLIEPMATSLHSMPSQAVEHAHDSAPGIMIPREGPEPNHPNAEQNIAAHDADHLPTHNVAHLPTDAEKDAKQGTLGPTEHNIAVRDADHLPIQHGTHMAMSPEQDAFQGMPGPRLPTHNVIEMPDHDEVRQMWGPGEHSTAKDDAAIAAHNVLDMPTDAEKDAVHHMPGPVDHE